MVPNYSWYFSVAEAGIENHAKSLGKSLKPSTVPPLVPPSPSIEPISVDADTSELLSIWSALDESARRDLLSVARSWAERSVDAAGRAADVAGSDDR
jgi:hypothetical protein